MTILLYLYKELWKYFISIHINWLKVNYICIKQCNYITCFWNNCILLFFFLLNQIFKFFGLHIFDINKQVHVLNCKWLSSWRLFKYKIIHKQTKMNYINFFYITGTKLKHTTNLIDEEGNSNYSDREYARIINTKQIFNYYFIKMIL